MKKIITGIVMGFLTIIFIGYIYGCFSTIHTHRDIINVLLEYYPDYKVEITDSDPNAIMILIKKGE